MDTRELQAHIREVPDFPRSGVNYKDVSRILETPSFFRHAVRAMARILLTTANTTQISKIVAIEARGFPLGGAVAYAVNAGVAMARKKGKLPGSTITADYVLEYGTASLEMQRSSILVNEQVFIVDDVLATGGTARAVADLVRELGGIVEGFLFLVELRFLSGREKLGHPNVWSIIQYDE